MRVELFAQVGQSRSSNVNAQRTINFVPILDPGSKNVKALIGSPGLTKVGTFAEIGCRGMKNFRGVGYAVYGDKFYTVSSSYVLTERGTLNTSSGPVTIAGNGDQVCICDGATLYVYTVATSVFAEVTDADFPGALTIDYIKGYGVFPEPNSQKFWITGLLDFTTVDGLDFASAEANCDNLKRCFVEGETLYLMGGEVIEPWYNSGDADFPFAAIAGGTIERGLLATYSVAKDDNAALFLGDDRIVYRMSGGQISKISSAQVDASIAEMENPTDAEGWVYSAQDSKFYVLTFPSAGITWKYDFSTGLWHERDSYDIGRWRAAWSMRLNNSEIVGDSLTGKLFKIDPTKYTEDGDTFVSSHIFPSISSENRIPHNQFELEFEAGVGLVTGQGSDPVALVSWSDDGGHVYGNDLEIKMGKIGEYTKRQNLYRLGSALDRRYRVRISDPVKRIIYGAYLNGRGA
jgi:hypothetical protein